MKRHILKIGNVSILLGLFILFYALTVYLLNEYRLTGDFPVFYASIRAAHLGQNPYLFTMADFLPTPYSLNINLNPPFFFLLTSPLAYFNLSYHQELILWITITSILALIGIITTIKISFSLTFIKRYWPMILIINLLFYGTMMNTAVIQLGGVLLFFIMLGYLCYLKHFDILAGTLWGISISLKLFPALLFFLVLREKRYRIFWIMLLSTCLFLLLPCFVYGTSIYQYYFAMLPKILWYGANWNASLYGFIFRCGMNLNSSALIKSQLAIIPLLKAIYIVLSMLILIGYWHLLKKKPKHRDQNFCLTLTLMILLSPFGWLYYFPLLLLPYAVTWQAYSQNLGSNHPICTHRKTIQMPQKGFHFTLCLTSFLLMNLPFPYIHIRYNPSLLLTIGFFSFYFYGLLALTYLCINIPAIEQDSKTAKVHYWYSYLPVFLIITTFSLHSILDDIFLLLLP